MRLLTSRWLRLPAAVRSSGILPLLLATAHAALELTPASPDSFPLVADGKAAAIHLPADAPEVVRLAAEDLADDIERVTGVRPQLTVRRLQPASPLVSLRLTATDHWETYRLTATADTLTIAGSDPRGLAYGIYDLSRRIGVSPWHWWADVPVQKRESLHLAPGEGPTESPAVKYRGIFLNDEGWGLHPWATKTHDPGTGKLGPETYARIFELLLRLRANAIWPAMHPCTTPFFQVPGNNETADNHAIVVGSSHAEPMLRNNVGEWATDKSHYNYLTHRDEVLGYWEERVRQRAAGESLFTLGMRGIHDSAIVGPRGQKERIATLERIFDDQRGLLSKHLDRDLAEIGQIFCPYKEVLDDYQAGLDVPDDVTLVWPDDNFGYIRHFATEAERARPGGSGVYYHLSYLGSPLSWLWFDSQSTALVWSEMKRAWELGACDVWIGNVGDLKGHELSTAWFLDLAWHADDHGPESAVGFLKRFTAECFGVEHAQAVADLWRRHQHLATARKPEHLQWHLSLTPYQPSAMTTREINDRLDACQALRHDATQTVARLPEAAQDAAFQLITYPIACADAANRRYFGLELTRRGHPEALEDAKAADREIHDLTRRYNEGVSDGKWRHIITAHGVSRRDWIRFQPTPFAQQLKELKIADSPPVEETSTPPTPPAGLEGPGFFEHGGVVSIHAGHFTGRRDADDGGWQIVPGLGRTGNAITPLPATLEREPSVSYRFHVSTGGPATLRLRLLPTHPVEGKERRVAITLDDGDPIELRAPDPKPKSDAWNREVLSNATYLAKKLPSELKPGWHTLELIASAPGIVVDKIVIDLGGLTPSYDGPPETRLPD